MQKRLLLFFMALLTSVAALTAATLPKLSSGSNVTWYFIKFVNGGNVVEARTDAQNVKQAGMTGRGAQLWKFEGNLSTGCTITNKLGQQLYVTSQRQNGMVVASRKASTYTQFVVQTSKKNKDYFEIHPVGHNNLSFNQWGGSGVGQEVGLWLADNDPNNVISFEDAATFEGYSKLPALIPYPQSLTMKTGVKLNAKTLRTVSFPADSVKELATDFAARLGKATGSAVTTKASGSSAEAGAVSLLTDRSLGAEAYKLTVTANGVEIRASSRAGFFYGLQTLSQLLPPAFFAGTPAPTADWSVPGLDINDKPLLRHRGYMLDVARHFFDKTEVKRIIDILALYKMNRLHWHLTDDQGWRIEIPEYPKLTSVGSRRAGSFVNDGINPWFFDDTEYGRGMYYTLADLREIVAYAAARNIEIMPEIDMPGHMVAALAAYPELSCLPKQQYKVRITPGISHDVLNVGDDKVIDFLKTVLGHVAEVFPGKYIHLGGDECPTDRWKNNALCRQRIKDEKLSGVEELQPWLVEHLAEFLQTKYKKQIVVWDELIAKDKTNFWKKPTTKVKPLIMAWNLPDGKRWDKPTEQVAADYGFQSVMCPYNRLYLDWMQVSPGEADVNEVYRGGWGDNNVNSVATVYNYDPLANLGSRSQFALGVQGNMWTETTNNNAELEYQLLPRLQALSEIAWLPAKQKDWTSFLLRLQSHSAIFDAMKFTYAKHYFFPAEDTEFDQVVAQAEGYLKAIKPGKVGHVSQADYTTFRNAVNAAKAAGANAAGAVQKVRNAINALRECAVVQPEAGKVYRLVSASTYYKKKYAGSTLYEVGGNLRVHYGQQDDAEELFSFVPSGEGYALRAVHSGNFAQLPTYDQAATMTAQPGTPLRIDAAKVPSGNYEYVPGVVVISAVEDYSASAGSNTKRLFIKSFGSNDKTNDVPNVNRVVAFDDPSLCNPGTWYIEEADFRVMLNGLLTRCNNTLADAQPNVPGQPSRVAVAFLNNVVTRIKAALAKSGNVTQATYNELVAQYEQFLQYPRTTPLEAIDQNYLYVIRNAYYDDYVARLDANGDIYPSKVVSGSKVPSNALWYVIKSNNGITIINKAGEKAATIYPVREGATVKTAAADTPAGKYIWQTRLYSTGGGRTGVNILDESGAYSWFAQPANYKTVVLKPADQGGSIWTFEKTDFTVGINEVRAAAAKASGQAHDLLGRPVGKDAHGIVIESDGSKRVR
jgi:glycosyl hydrolase family 20, domain 2